MAGGSPAASELCDKLAFTEKSGKTFRTGSHYFQSGGGEWPVDTKAISGQKSDDDFVDVGGATVRKNPDATHAEIVGCSKTRSPVAMTWAVR